jgi:hypothetical protein
MQGGRDDVRFRPPPVGRVIPQIDFSAMRRFAALRYREVVPRVSLKAGTAWDMVILA